MPAETTETVRDWCQCCGSRDLRPGASIESRGVTLAPVCRDCWAGSECVRLCGPDHDCRATGCDDDCEACCGQ